MVIHRFEWDEAKNRANLRKHGVSFEESMRVFFDPLHRSVLERIEGREQRWQTLGVVGGSSVVLVVAHTASEEDCEGQTIEIIRIISARRADRTERRRYENESNV